MISFKNNLAVIVIFLMLSFTCLGQKKLFFNEAFISVNRSNVKNSNTIDMFGYGIGLNKFLFNKDRFCIGVGLGYDMIRQKKKHFYENRFTSIHNVTYDIHNVVLPVYGRFDLIKDNFYLELGLFGDFIIHSKREGTYVSSSSLALTGNYSQVTKQHSGKGNLYHNNFGGTLGMGIRVPFRHLTFFVKPEYKFGVLDLSQSPQTSLTTRYFKLSVGLAL